MTLFPETWCFFNEHIHGTVLKITVYVFHLSPSSSHFHPLQVESCDSSWRLVVDENDNGKFRLERVNVAI